MCNSPMRVSCRAEPTVTCQYQAQSDCVAWETGRCSYNDVENKPWEKRRRALMCFPKNHPFTERLASGNWYERDYLFDSACQNAIVWDMELLKPTKKKGLLTKIIALLFVIALPPRPSSYLCIHSTLAGNRRSTRRLRCRDNNYRSLSFWGCWQYQPEHRPVLFCLMKYRLF